MPIRFRFPSSPTTRRQRPTWWTRSDSITDLMIPAQPAGRPSMDRWPVRWQAPAFGAMAVATGLVAIAPLASLAVVTIIIGASTGWLVTTFAFPGRDALSWLLPLPLAIPTYIVAYVYVDILDALGPVQSALRAVFGWHSAADYWFPNVRSLAGAILLFGFVLYPYVYLAARAMFQTQGPLF